MDSKYVVVSDPVVLGHVIQRTRNRQNMNGNTQLKPMGSIFVYYLTTDKAMITKLHHDMKQATFDTKFSIWGKRGVA